MNHTITKVSLAAILLLACKPTLAATFTFEDLPGSNLDSFSSYSADGFTVTAVEGEWQVGKVFGNPVPSIFCNCQVGSVALTGDANELFQFTSVDFGYRAATYSITGMLNDSPVFTQTGTIGAATDFFTIASEDSQSFLDALMIQLSPGTGPGFNIDNISYNIVPSPSTGVLVGFGLLYPAFVRRF